jgi:glutamyl-tRNA reductase
MDMQNALDRLREFDVVCCATRSSVPLLTRRDVETAAPLLIFDVSVPRNVDPAAGEVPGVALYDIDAIRPAPARSDAALTLIDSIIDAELHDYFARAGSRDIAPIIASLRRHVDRVREQEVERISGKLAGLDAPERAAVESLTQRLIDRMFHHLVVRLKLAALTDPELVRAADFFFAHGEDALFPLRAETEITSSTTQERDLQSVDLT